MILAATITQLRAAAPVFGGRVAGAAEFVRGVRDYTTALPLPAAYVMPVSQEADSNQSWGGLQQLVHYVIGVAVELDAQTDRRGQTPAMDLDGIRDEIFAAILNYKIDDCHVARGMSFVGGHYLDLDRARLFFQFDFLVDWQITDADGFDNNASAVPIESIEIDIFGPHGVPAPGTDPAAVVVIATAEDGTTPPPPTDGPWPPPSTKRTDA